MPDLDYHVEGVEVLEYAAAPTLAFKLAIANRGSEAIPSILLNVQIRIAPARRHYQPDEQGRLIDVFGTPDRWGTTLQTMLWTHATALVCPFDGRTVVDLHVPCTSDLEVASAKYFHALSDGEAPLEFLFSGTVFYAGERVLQAVQIPWEKEAEFRLPIARWREMMDHYFPNSTWLRLHRDRFDRLSRDRSRRGLPTWEAALERLLRDDQEAE